MEVKNKMKNIRYQIILALFLISLISSVILSTKTASEICNASNGCEIVYYSQYNSLLGISNAYYGIIIFAFLSIWMISYLINPSKTKKMIINLAIIIGSVIAIYFLYIQNFVLEAYCRYCLIIDFSTIISFALIIPDLKKGFLSFKNEKNIAAGS
jgi:uncharacterized membrane protein